MTPKNLDLASIFIRDMEQLGRSKWAAIKLNGEIDIARVDKLSEVLAREWLPTQSLLIDLCAVRFMDSAGSD
ncbi:MAG TPA: STAS domain-containing protein [Acidimicrobiia bacterium]|nr:STAS domain-containing protein [Acidimicrobiia bacterium]